jgi:predicted GIY-YIG superfamily endonuclease
MNDRATVYMVRCSDGHYYVGITRTEPETRISQPVEERELRGHRHR